MTPLRRLCLNKTRALQSCLLRLHHGEREPHDLCRSDVEPLQSGIRASHRKVSWIHLEVQGSQACLLAIVLRSHRRDRSRKADQAMATREKEILNREAQSPMARPLRGCTERALARLILAYPFR